MKFAASFVALLAAAQSVVAKFVEPEESLTSVSLTRLVCDGDSSKCTASLDFGDGKWVAQWSTAVFHTTVFGVPDHKEVVAALAAAPVPITRLVCDGDLYRCTANLKFGDGRWVARWSTNVFHQGPRSGDEVSLDPYSITRLHCDGENFKCTAHLHGRWVAQWNTNVFHTKEFLEQPPKVVAAPKCHEPVPASVPLWIQDEL